MRVNKSHPDLQRFLRSCPDQPGQTDSNLSPFRGDIKGFVGDTLYTTANAVKIGEKYSTTHDDVYKGEHLFYDPERGSCFTVKQNFAGYNAPGAFIMGMFGGLFGSGVALLAFVIFAILGIDPVWAIVVQLGSIPVGWLGAIGATVMAGAISSYEIDDDSLFSIKKLVHQERLTPAGRALLKQKADDRVRFVDSEQGETYMLIEDGRDLYRVTDRAVEEVRPDQARQDLLDRFGPRACRSAFPNVDIPE